MLNQKDILQTLDMIDKRHLDIRTITMGISLLDCCDVDLDACLRLLREVHYQGTYSLETFYWNNLSVSLRENLQRDRRYVLQRYADI